MISSTYKVKSDSTRSNYSERIKSKPLSLKQRTSSVDSRRDYTIQSWTSLLGLVKPREYFVTVDNFSIWRRHLAWAMENGGDLRNYMTQRYASNMVFMSLLLGAELNVLFNSSTVTTHMRKNLYDENWNSVGFFAGIMILVSVILTILSLISTFTGKFAPHEFTAFQMANYLTHDRIKLGVWSAVYQTLMLIVSCVAPLDSMLQSYLDDLSSRQFTRFWYGSLYSFFSCCPLDFGPFSWSSLQPHSVFMSSPSLVPLAE